MRHKNKNKNYMTLNNKLWKIFKNTILLMITISFITFLTSLVSNATYTINLRSPIVFQSPVYLQKRIISLNIHINQAHAEELKKAVTQSPTLEEYIIGKFGKDGQVALAIAKAESSMRCNAVGDKNLTPKSYGLFQIRAFKGRPTAKELMDCFQNVDTAHKIYQTQGFSPWSAYKNGKYKKFIK